MGALPAHPVIGTSNQFQDEGWQRVVVMAGVGPKELELIVDKLTTFDASVVQWKVTKDGKTERLDVSATKEALCSFSVEIQATNGRDYGFYFGHGASLESLNPDEYNPLHLADAVMAGSVRERIWRLGRSFVVRSEAKLILHDGRELLDQSTIMPWLWQLAPVLDVAYRSYSFKS